MIVTAELCDSVLHTRTQHFALV